MRSLVSGFSKKASGKSVVCDTTHCDEQKGVTLRIVVNVYVYVSGSKFVVDQNFL